MFQDLMTDIAERSLLPVPTLHRIKKAVKVEPEIDDLLSEFAREIASTHYDIHTVRLDTVDIDKVCNLLKDKMEDLIHGS